MLTSGSNMNAYAEMLTPDNLADIQVEQYGSEEEFLFAQNKFNDQAEQFEKIPVSCSLGMANLGTLVDAVARHFNVPFGHRATILHFLKNGELRIGFWPTVNEGCQNRYYLIPPKLVPKQCDLCAAASKMNARGSVGN